MEEYEKYQFKLKVVALCKFMFVLAVVFGVSMFVAEHRTETKNMSNSGIEQINITKSKL